jgi:hypothetical protein
MMGVTEMPGIDDYGAKETFTQADAITVLNGAESKGISTLSFWAHYLRAVHPAASRDNAPPGGQTADRILCGRISS